MSKQESEFGKGCAQQLAYFAKHFSGEAPEGIIRLKTWLDKHMRKTSIARILVDMPNDPFNKCLVDMALKKADEERKAISRKKKLKPKQDAMLYTKLLRKYLAESLRHRIHLFFNGASDHLYELLVPPKASRTLKKKILELRELALTAGHGFTKKQEKLATYNNFIKAMDLTFEIARMIDRSLGLNPITARWT
jgi:hypothetical protein